MIVDRLKNKLKIFFLYHYYNARNKNLSIFEIDKLSHYYEIFAIGKHQDNYFYGINQIVRDRYPQHSMSKVAIEHGIYFGEYVNESFINPNHTQAVFTYGQYREDVLKREMRRRNLDIPVYQLGIYINYFDSLISKKELKAYKEKLGKVLLVFPSHSSDVGNTKYDIEKFIIEIKKHVHNFDTILVCLYWKDIQDGMHVMFQKENFQVVTAGVRSDKNFLRRLKSIILLSDYTISNQLGTHIGYCIANGKPHFLYKQEIVINDSSSRQQHNYQEVLEKEKELFYRVFGKFSESITEEQIELVRKYWGDF